MDLVGGWGDEPERIMLILSTAGGVRKLQSLTIEEVAKVAIIWVLAFGEGVYMILA